MRLKLLSFYPKNSINETRGRTTILNTEIENKVLLGEIYEKLQKGEIPTIEIAKTINNNKGRTIKPLPPRAPPILNTKYNP